MFIKHIYIIYSKFQLTRRFITTIQNENLFPRCSSSFVNLLEIVNSEEQVPIYRLIDPSGQPLNSSELFSIEEDFTIKLYKSMKILQEIDKILYESQRQGRISFYLTSYGEEGTQIGSAAGLKLDDLIFPQYREAGVLLWRGFTIDQIMNQCFGNKDDLGKGKQMPVHYGSKEHHYVTVSSPLATQMPQAVGAAYAYKLAKNGRCIVTYFGDGSASEGDAHAAFNFSATLECPIIFFCRNNGYAISTPISEQYKGNGIASRAAGYGISAIRVDGNDVLAVYNATKIARSYVMNNNKPIILEAFTYRVGHHSTSDDSNAYRLKDEIDKWKLLDPIIRLKYFMEKQGWWNDEIEKKWLTNIKKEIIDSLTNAEKKLKPNWQEMFNDVYEELPEYLKKQRQYMENHIKKYKQYYPLDEFEQL